MVHQRDIVEIAFGNGIDNHPAIVLSNALVQEVEGAFVCVMMTSKDYDDEFSFKIDDTMVVKPLSRKHCEARCHLIQYVEMESIIINSHNNQLKIDPFKKLIKKINDTTFSMKEL